MSDEQKRKALDGPFYQCASCPDDSAHPPTDLRWHEAGQSSRFGHEWSAGWHCQDCCDNEYIDPKVSPSGERLDEFLAREGYIK